MTQESATGRPGQAGDELTTVTAQFEYWAARTPGATAVAGSGLHLIYGQINTDANRLARHLLAAGLPEGAVVAVDLPVDSLMTGVLAVLKAGGTYAILARDTPRLARQQLALLGPFAVLTDSARTAQLDDGRGLRMICPDAAEQVEAIAAQPPLPPDRPAAGTAALVCTDGPRAVPVSRERLAAAVVAWAEAGHLIPHDRHLFTAPADTAAFATGWPRALCTGGTLILPAASTYRDRGPDGLVSDEAVTVVYTDPAGLTRLLGATGPEAPAAPAPGIARPQRNWPVRLLAVTGGRLYLDEQSAAQSRLSPGVRLVNAYGTAETAGAGTWFELPQLSGPVIAPDRLSLLGTPHPGYRAELRDTAADGTGEILLAAPGGGPAVPTGDLGRLRPDGLLEYAGRIRDRITADGRSTDPHRAESLLRTHPQLSAVAITRVPDLATPDKLVAYVVPAPGVHSLEVPGPYTLRRHLAAAVPDADVPTTVVPVRALPRGRSGQEDRAALPLPAQPAKAGSGSGKYGGFVGAGGPARRPSGVPHAPNPAATPAAAGCSVVLAVIALLFTGVFWPGSTDLTGVPAPWSLLFRGLYLAECLAFGAGVLFLVTGRRWMRRAGRPSRLTAAAHLAVVWLLVSWWPQDNFYRLAAKNDWPRQAALVYVFNIPLMVAAAVVALYVTRKPDDPLGFDER
ncbi:AMP-binding protein [Streptomyces sp. NBC_00239]|uniref:AMP-binding protein n=1 Tax=Streptomyces sp. NBC_00239 TaxID=2903640 RepID=UPI002E29B7E6|nr:AMP-binding protein [Streptomyces sp. NBC_00239]